MATAKGQITIVDLNDGKTLSLYLRPRHPQTQIYNTDNKQSSPNWSATNNEQRIYPELYVSGNANNVIGSTSAPQANIKYYIVDYTATTPKTEITTTYNATYGTQKHQGSTPESNYISINKNMVAPQYIIECQVTYHDVTTNIDTVTKATLSLTKSETAGSVIAMSLYTPEGYTFNNDAVTPSKAIKSLSIIGEMWRGSEVDHTGIDVTWYKDGVALTWSNRGNIAFYWWEESSSTWKQVTASDYSTKLSIAEKIVVTSDDVAYVSVFKCVIGDADSQSSTFEQSVTDAVTLYDMTDPFRVDITSSTGETLTPSAPETFLNAVITQKGENLPTGTGSVYTSAKFLWTMNDSNGVLKKYYNPQTGAWVTIDSTHPLPTSGYSGSSAYSNIKVSRSDIVYRCRIFCEVTNITI